MKRQPDGKWRGVRQPVVASESMLRARWVEAETICLKRMGLSFDAIADQITAVGLGKATPMVAIPAGVSFPPDYGITKQACHKAFRKAIKREPSIELDEMRKLDTARSEEMFANLQPAIRKGNPKAIQVGIGVLDHTAKINGLQRRKELSRSMVRMIDRPSRLFERFLETTRSTRFRLRNSCLRKQITVPPPTVPRLAVSRHLKVIPWCLTMTAPSCWG
jgi:hypothetical protein